MLVKNSSMLSSLHAARYCSRDADTEDVEISVVAVSTTSKTTTETTDYVGIESGYTSQTNIL
jgi:hypothetical protein